MHVPWALLADSSSGSTWVNHVLSSHPCSVSEGEVLMKNATASALFHASAAGIAAVLHDITVRNQRTLASTPGAAHCSSTAGGLKLKLGERDILLGSESNALQVARELRRLGYRIILLQRTNHLDNLLGRQSRHRTGVLHCRSRGNVTRTCQVNSSIVLNCKKAMHSIDRLRLRQRASEVIFSDSSAAGPLRRGRLDRPRAVAAINDGTGHLLRLEYEDLVGSSHMWLAALRLLGLPVESACRAQRAPPNWPD